MKEALREAGVPTAASTAADTAARGLRLRRRRGLPADPQAAQPAPGRSDTTRVDNRGRAGGGARRASAARASTSIAVEEFVEGHEGFYDTLSIDGRRRPRLRLALLPQRAGGDAHPVDLAAVRLDEPGRLGRRSTASCARWATGSTRRSASAPAPRTWSGSSGRRACSFSEIGCRPPGVGAWDLYSAGNDLDLYREWAQRDRARQVADARRRGGYASGIVALRPDRDGQISGYSGVDEIQARHGEWVHRRAPAEPGTPTQPVEAGYMANAYVRMRHPDYDALRGDARRRRPHRARPRRREPLVPACDHPARAATAAHGPTRWCATSTADARWPRSPPAGRSASPTTPSCDALLGGRARQPRPARPLARRPRRATRSTPPPSSTHARCSTSSGSSTWSSSIGARRDVRARPAQRRPARGHRGARWPTPRRSSASSTTATSRRVRAAHRGLRAACRRRGAAGRSPSTAPRCARCWSRRPALVVAGGHVGVLLRVLQLFDVSAPSRRLS